MYVTLTFLFWVSFFLGEDCFQGNVSWSFWHTVMNPFTQFCTSHVYTHFDTLWNFAHFPPHIQTLQRFFCQPHSHLMFVRQNQIKHQLKVKSTTIIPFFLFCTDTHLIHVEISPIFPHTFKLLWDFSFNHNFTFLCICKDLIKIKRDHSEYLMFVRQNQIKHQRKVKY